MPAETSQHERERGRNRCLLLCTSSLSLSSFLSSPASSPHLLSLKAFTELEMMKLWKGLYMCMWHSDKPLVQVRAAVQCVGGGGVGLGVMGVCCTLCHPYPQEELAENIASFVHILQNRGTGELGRECSHASSPLIPPPSHPPPHPPSSHPPSSHPPASQFLSSSLSEVLLLHHVARMALH